VHRVAIIQSNYLPWKGYFDIIDQADQFVVYDTADYTKNDWRNRNRIRTRDGLLWLTVPIASKGRSHAPINSMQVTHHAWAENHYRSLRQWYAKAACYDDYEPLLRELYDKAATLDLLSDINRLFIDACCDVLGITTAITNAESFDVRGGPTERLAGICRAAGATHYLSGPAAKAYLDHDVFEAAGIEVEYMDYTGYPVYQQCYEPFVHEVSIIDLLLHKGKEAGTFMRRHRDGELE